MGRALLTIFGVIVVIILFAGITCGILDFAGVLNITGKNNNTPNNSNSPNNPTNPTNPTNPGTPHEHTWGNWVIEIAPTCQDEGREKRTCTTDNTHFETRSIPAMGHDWGEWTTHNVPQYVDAGNLKFKETSAGWEYTLALAENGDLYAWGRNNYGQLGLGDNTERDTPTHISQGNRKYKAISAGPSFALAIAENGDLYAWGHNNDGQLGLGDSCNGTNRNIPHLVAGGHKYKAVAGGNRFTLAITENGDLYAWGTNGYGVLGLGISAGPASTPRHVNEGGRKYKAIATGQHSSFAIAENGDLYAWGENTNGQLGLGDIGHATNRYTPQHVSAGRKYKAIAGGDFHTVAIAENGDLYSWGHNRFGQLGLGDSVDYYTPQHANAGNRKYKAIAAGSQSSIAIAENGDLYTWGLNGGFGQLGLGNSEHHNTPQHVSANNRKYDAIAMGFRHTLAITENNDLYAFGSNEYGQLGLCLDEWTERRYCTRCNEFQTR